jgi:hypothetical protein
VILKGEVLEIDLKETKTLWGSWLFEATRQSRVILPKPLMFSITIHRRDESFCREEVQWQLWL